MCPSLRHGHIIYLHKLITYTLYLTRPKDTKKAVTLINDNESSISLQPLLSILQN